LAFAFPFFTPYFVPFRIVICPALRDKFCVRFVFVLPCKTLGPAQGEPTTGTWTATETRDRNRDKDRTGQCSANCSWSLCLYALGIRPRVAPKMEEN